MLRFFVKEANVEDLRAYTQLNPTEALVHRRLPLVAASPAVPVAEDRVCSGK